MTSEFSVEKARECLLDEIVGCYNCQPCEGGPVWLGPKCSLTELLVNCAIDEGHWTEVLEDFNCPNCGTSLNSEWDDVEIRSDYDKKIEAVLTQASSPELAGKLSQFGEFLENYPYLGAADPQGVGADIIQRIKRWPATQLEHQTWFRARLVKESRIYSPKEMCAPNPAEVYVKEGRYNHTGQSFLYLASDRETAFLEKRQANENLCALQRFKARQAIRVLDVRHNYAEVDPTADLLAIALIYNGSLSQKAANGTSWKPQYFVPRFVADCARLCGYDGLWFSSAVHFGGENLVVFPPKDSLFEPEGECEPFVWKQSDGTIDLGWALLHI